MSDIVGKIKVALGFEIKSSALSDLNAQINKTRANAKELQGVLNQTAHSAAAFNGSAPRSLGSGLSAATVKATEFSKAIEASNARVLAFAASAGAMFQVVNAMKMIVRSTIDIEKKLMDVNVILGESRQGLEKFTAGLFQISRSTAQSFEVVAEAATEFARQGLSAEETLKRTKDALILTRLSGMDAAASVSSLTAALNTFNKEGLTSTQVINKMAMVDSAFAVSTTDLAESMRRVGSTAQDVGVSFNQLLAVTAALQQKTARGGPVIGNALKSIFTRIQRTETLDELESLGVAVRDMSGEMLPAMTVLQNMANVFPTLSKAQQAHTAEIVGSVFQMNNLRALLQDLGGGYSVYRDGLDKANSATDEAIERNELLNTTLSARLVQTYSKLTSVAQKFGDVAFRPAMERLVDSLSGALGTLEPDEDAGKSFGDKIGKGMISGLGDFIAGPGLATVLVVLGKLAGNVTTFMRTALAEFIGIQTKTLQIKQIQEALNSLYSKQPELINLASHSTEARLFVEQQILNTLVEQGRARAAQAESVDRQAAEIYARGGTISSSGQIKVPPHLSGTPITVSPGLSREIEEYFPSKKSGKRKAFGHVPNFNRTDATMETIGAISGGYMPGKIQQMNIPGLGKITYNGREEVKHVPGFSQPFINPPEHSKAGKLHKSSAIRKTGINPYAAYGFLPNFRPVSQEEVSFAAQGFLPNFAGVPKNLSHLIESLKADGLKGKTFYVEYLKKNGEIAQRTGRLGAYKPPITNGVGAQYDPLEYNLLRYFDMGRGAYRHAKYDNIRKIHFGSSKYQRNEKGEFESYAAAGFIPNFASGRLSPKTDWRHSQYLTKRASLRNEAQAAKEKAAREHHPLTERPQYEAKLQRVFNGLHPALREKLADADLLNYAPPVRLPSAHIPSDQGQQYIKNFFENIPDTFAVRGHQAGKFEGQAVKRLHKPSAPLEPGAALYGEASISGVDRWSTKGLSKKTTGIDSLNELETVFMANSGRNRPGWGSFTGSVDVARRFAAESGSMMHRGTSEEVSEALVSRMNARREPEQPYDKRFSFAMQSLKRPKAPEISFLPVKLLDKEKTQEFIKGYRSLGPMEDKEHLAMSALMGAKGRYNIGFNYSSWEKLPPGEPPTRIPPLDFVKPAPNEDLYRSAVHIREREFGVIGSVKRFAADALSLKAFKLKHKAEYDAMLMQEYGSQKDIPQEFLSKGHVPNFKPLDLIVNSVIASASRGNSRFEPSSLRSQLGKDWLQTSTTTSEIYSSAGPEKGKYNDVLPASLRDQNLSERQIFSGIMKRTAGENVTLHFPGRFNLEDHALGDHQLEPLRKKLRANLSPTLDKLAQIPLGQGYVKEFDKILAGGPKISSTRIPEIQQWQSSMPPELKKRSKLQVALGQYFNKTYAEEAVLMGMKTAKSPLGGNLYSDIQNVGHLGGKLWDLTLLQGKRNYFGEVKTSEDTRSLGSTGMKEIKSQNEIWSKILRDLIGPENRTDPRSILEHQYLQAFEEKAKQTRSFSARHKTAFATHPAQTEGTARSGLFYGKSSSGLVPNFSPGTFGFSKKKVLAEQIEAARKFLNPKEIGQLSRLSGADQYEEFIQRVMPLRKQGEFNAPSRKQLTKSLKEKTKIKSLEKLDYSSRIGTELAARLDIPSSNRGAPAITVHESRGRKNLSVGDVLSYENAVSLSDPSFSISQKASLAIAQRRTASGKDIKGKFPMATVVGNLQKKPSQKEIRQRQREWLEAGINPQRHSYLYDKTTQEPIVGGEEAMLVGHGVYVRKPIFGNKEDYLYSSGLVPNFAPSSRPLSISSPELIQALPSFSSGRELLKFLASVGAQGNRGSSRMFIPLDDKKGLKVALNKAGVAQNEVEFPILNSDWYAKDRYSDILPKGHGFDENNYLWGIMEKLRIPSRSDFKKLTGKHKDLFLQSGKRSSLSENEELIESFAADYGTILGDFRRGANTGIGQRPHRQQDLFNPAAGEDYIKLLDIGFNKVVADKFYRHGARPQNGVWNFSEGMVPNFIKSPLQESIEREKKGTGLPLNQIYTDYVNTSKYRGPVVANKKDEPTRAALLRAVTSHPNPATAGTSRGHIPNFMSDAGDIGTSISSMGFMLMMSGVGQKLNPALAEYKKNFEALNIDLTKSQKQGEGLNKQVKIDEKVAQRANNAQILHATRLDYLNKDLSKESKLNRKIALAHSPLAAAFTEQKLVTGEAIEAEQVRMQALKNLGITDSKALEHGTVENKAEVSRLAKEKASAEQAQQKAKDTAKAERDDRKQRQKELAKRIDQLKIQSQAARDAQKFFTTSIPEAEAYAGNAKQVGPIPAQLPESRTRYAERVKVELSKSISSLQGKVGGISAAEAAAKRAFEGKDFTSSLGGKSAAEKLYIEGQELRRVEKAQITAQLGAEKLKLAQANKVVAEAAKANTASKALPKRIQAQEQAYQATEDRAADAKPGHEKNLRKLNQSTIAATLSYNAVQTSSDAHVAAQQKLTAANQLLTAQTQQAVVSHTAAGEPINARLTAASMALGLSRQAAGENASQQASLKANLAATGQSIATEQNKPFFGKGGTAAKFIHQRGFGVGIAAQMGSGIAGELAYGDDRSREGRKGKSAISGVGTVMGMAGMGAMLGPWGAAAGAIIGTGLALWDYSKKSKKNAEDYALELDKLTEKQREGVAALRTYTEMTDALLNAYNRGASSTEIKSIEKNLTEAFSDIEDQSLRASIATAGNDANKLNEAMVKLSESLSITTRQSKVAEEMNRIGKENTYKHKDKRSLGRRIALAFPDLKNEGLLDSGQDIKDILMGVGIKGNPLQDMLEEITEGGFRPDALITALQEAFKFLDVQKESKRFADTVSSLGQVIIKENELIKKLTSAHERYFVTLQAQFEGSLRMSDLLSSSLAQDSNIPKFESMDKGLTSQYNSNVERLAATNAGSSQAFFRGLTNDLTGKNEGAISDETRKIREFSIESLKNKTPFDEQKLRALIEKIPTSSVRVDYLDKLNRFAAELEKNTIETSEQNRLLVIQDQLRRMEISEASRQKLRTQADFTTPYLFEDALGKLFKSFNTAPGQFATARTGAQKVEGLQSLEKMGFDFENTAIGKNFKNKIMADSFRAQAPLALRSLGMNEGDIETIKNSGYNQDVSKAVIDKQNSAQADLMAQVIDSANLEKIAEKEKDYKTKLFEAEQQARSAMVTAMGGNVDATYNLISSNYSLIGSHLNLINSNSAASSEFKRALEEHGTKMALLDVQRKKAESEGKAASSLAGAVSSAAALQGEYGGNSIRQINGDIYNSVGQIMQGTAMGEGDSFAHPYSRAGEMPSIDLFWMQKNPKLVEAFSRVVEGIKLEPSFGGGSYGYGVDNIKVFGEQVREPAGFFGGPKIVRSHAQTILSSMPLYEGKEPKQKVLADLREYQEKSKIPDPRQLAKINLAAYMVKALGKKMEDRGVEEMPFGDYNKLEHNQKSVLTDLTSEDSDGWFGVNEGKRFLEMLDSSSFQGKTKEETLFNFLKALQKSFAESERKAGGHKEASLVAATRRPISQQDVSSERTNVLQKSLKDSDESNQAYFSNIEGYVKQMLATSEGKLGQNQKDSAFQSLSRLEGYIKDLGAANSELGELKISLGDLSEEIKALKKVIKDAKVSNLNPTGPKTLTTQEETARKSAATGRSLIPSFVPGRENLFGGRPLPGFIPRALNSFSSLNPQRLGGKISEWANIKGNTIPQLPKGFDISTLKKFEEHPQWKAAVESKDIDYQNTIRQAFNEGQSKKFDANRPIVTVPTIDAYTPPQGLIGRTGIGTNDTVRPALAASIKMFGTPDRKESGAYRMSLHQSSREQEVYQQMMKESGMGGKFRALVENPALKTAQSAYQSAIDLNIKHQEEKKNLETQELPLARKMMDALDKEVLANEEALARSVGDPSHGDFHIDPKYSYDSLNTARKEQEAQASILKGLNLKLKDLDAALVNDLPGVKSALQGLADLKFDAQMDRLDERLANLGLELDMWKNPAQGLTLSMMEAKEKVLEQSIILEKLNTVLGESANLESERGPILELLIEAQRKQAEAAVKQAEMSQLTGAGTGKDVYEEKLRGIKEQLRRGEVSLGGAIGLEGLAKAEADLVDFKENIFNTMKEIREGMKSDIKDGFSQWALEGAKAEDVLKNIGRSFAKRLMDMAYDMSIGRMMDQLFSGTMFSGDFIPNALADEKSGGGKIQRFNSGGYVQGPKRGIDSVKAYLAPGEFVLKEPATRSIRQKFGDSALTRLNSLGSPGMQSVSGFAEGGIVGPTKDPRNPLGLPMLLDEDPLFVFGKQGQRDVAGTASQAVRYGQVRNFTEKDKQAATVVFGETGPHLYKQMDVVGNTVRNRMDSPNYLPDESSVHGTLTRPGQFDAFENQKSDNMRKANAMSSFMKSPVWDAAGKPQEGDAGNAARDRQWTSMLQNVKWARGKEKAATHGLNQEDITAWQAALFYGSDKGTLSGRYPGITAYSSPVDAKNTWRTVPGRRMVNGKIIQLPDNDPGAALTQIGLDLKAHQTTLGGVQKGNVGNVAFHGYTSPVSGDFGSFVNDGAKAAALGNQTFMPFMQRINNDKVQKASARGINNRDTLARNWRAVGGSAGWEGLSPEAKLEFNVNSAKTLRINDAGYSSSQQFLKNIQRKKEGGVVSGVGRGDRVPILAEPREFIFKRRTADAIGHEKLNELNSFPERFSIKRKMALGGTVTGGSVIGAPATTGEPTKPDWESTSSHPDVPMTHPQGENRINFSGRTPEMANMGADTADFGELNVHGLATQDKTWYTAGHMPSQTLEDVAERASATRLDGDTLSDAVKLQFVMNDKEKPTLGKFLGDHDKYTNYMLEDTENPQNELRNKRQDMLFDYVDYVQGEIKKRRETMQEFRDKVDQTVKAGWIQAAVAWGAQALGELAKSLPDESGLKQFMQSKGGAALGGAVAGFAVPAAMGGKDWQKHALIGSIAGAGAGYLGKWQAEKASEEFATGELQRASSEQLEAMAAGGTDKYGNQFNEKQKEALKARAARLRVAETDYRNKLDVNRLKADVGKARSRNNGPGNNETEKEVLLSTKLATAQEHFEDYRRSNKSDFAEGKSGSVDGWRFHMAPELSPGNKLSTLKYDVTQKKNIFRQLTSSLGDRLKQKPREPIWRRDGGLIGFQNGGGVKDTVPVMVAPGEFIVSKDAAGEVGYSYLNRLNRYGSSAMRSDLPGFQEGGVVGRTGTDSGAGVAFSVPNHDGMSDVISQLIDIAQSIRDSIEASKEETSTKNQDSPTNESSGKSGGNITNNVNVTVNLSRGGETTEVSSSQESNGEEKEDSPKGKEKEEKFAVMLKGVVLQTIVEQQRPGGLLSD